jgi:hypothetical protein
VRIRSTGLLPRVSPGEAGHMLQGTPRVWLLGAAALVTACGSSTREGPCSVIESVRRQIYDVERADLDSDDWTKQQPPERRHKAAEATVAELEATCTTAHWSKETIDCLIASAKGAETRAEPASCKNSPSNRIVTRAFDEAEERARVKQFGPRPRNAFDEFTEKWERWEQRKASSVEPRVVIPARYPGLAWFRARRARCCSCCPSPDPRASTACSRASRATTRRSRSAASPA